MAKRASSKVNSNWLLTCSDLFFLLVAFFVLNHALILKNKNVKNPTELKIPQANKKAETPVYGKSLFIYDYTSQDAGLKALGSKDLSYFVSNKWFTDGSTLTPFAETRISVIENSVKNLSGKAMLNLKLPPDSQSENINKNLQTLQNILLQRTGKKVPVLITSNKSISNYQIELVVRF